MKSDSNHCHCGSEPQENIQVAVAEVVESAPNSSLTESAQIYCKHLEEADEQFWRIAFYTLVIMLGLASIVLISWGVLLHFK